ncbi:DUF998 domain-containing protein [Halorubrum sp. Ea8]|uniref:DUF998 domain-containing protein n=1 Tax=Halorubrum sp. Ea8 TaxID=1383841 RepID=UPI0015960B9F|nr:DUF998 domain-containing protein [Halorubrum sp. Ea8]
MNQIESNNDVVLSLRGLTFRSRKLAGVLFFVLAAQFMTVIMLAAAMAPDYDFGAAAISDLGVLPETALLFNGSLVLVGLLNLLGGYLFYQSHGRRWLLGIFAVAGVGAVGAGLFPLDTGGLHGLFALLAFLFFNLQALGSSARLSGVMRVLAVLAGSIGILFVVLMAIGDAGNAAAFGPIGHGGTERMIVYPVMLWMLAFGGYLLGTSRRELEDDSRPGSA